MVVNLNGVPETLLITVRARAEETHRPDFLLFDPYAVDILKKIKHGKDSQQKVAASSQIGVVIRTLLFDKLVKEFLTTYPRGVVVALGCGLDARYERLQLPCYCWYDLDVQEAIETRKAFFTEKENYRMIAASMFDYDWMNEIPANHPLLIISEGVFMYFPEEKLKAMVTEIFRRFSHAQIAFDSIPPFLVKRTKLHTEVRKYNASFKWGVDKPEELKQWDNRIQILSTDYYMDYYLKRWPFSMRLIRMVPKFRRGNKVVRIGLGES